MQPTTNLFLIRKNVIQKLLELPTVFNRIMLSNLSTKHTKSLRFTQHRRRLGKIRAYLLSGQISADCWQIINIVGEQIND